MTIGMAIRFGGWKIWIKNKSARVIAGFQGLRAYGDANPSAPAKGGGDTITM